MATSVDDAEPALAAMSMDDERRRLDTPDDERAKRARAAPDRPRGAWSAPVALGPGRLAALAMDLDGDALALRAVSAGPARVAQIYVTAP